MNDISFGASFKKLATVKKLVNGRYEPLETSIVKADYSDLASISKTARIWKRPFACQVEQAIELSKFDGDSPVRDVYILTRQKTGVEKLIPEEILGMAYLYKGFRVNSLEYIQVHPSIEITNYPIVERMRDSVLGLFKMTKNRTRQYTEVGTELVKFLQETYNDKCMSLAAACTSENFYKKLGFKRGLRYFTSHMIWTPKSSE